MPRPAAASAPAASASPAGSRRPSSSRPLMAKVESSLSTDALPQPGQATSSRKARTSFSKGLSQSSQRYS